MSSTPAPCCTGGLDGTCSIKCALTVAYFEGKGRDAETGVCGSCNHKIASHPPGVATTAQGMCDRIVLCDVV
jgi:hypothetical protein